MSMIATSIPTVAAKDIGPVGASARSCNDVVEIGLLLPTNWANMLVELSRQRHQSVAQVLRTIIGGALHDLAAPL